MTRIAGAVAKVRLGASGVHESLRRVPTGYCVVAALGILIAVVVADLLILPTIRHQWGEDYRFFMVVADRWRTGQSVYLPHQLSGPYVQTSGVDMIYPPPALLLFVPMSFLPAPLWWILPLGTVAIVVAYLRPEPWTWVILALAVWYPRDQSMIIWGNTGMWMAAFVALGILWGWPAALILMKPSLLPFVAAGVRRPRALIAGIATLALVSLLMLPLWVDFFTAVVNAGSTWPSLLYSLPDIPLLLVPVIAWVGRTRKVGIDVTQESRIPSRERAEPPAAATQRPDIARGNP